MTKAITLLMAVGIVCAAGSASAKPAAGKKTFTRGQQTIDANKDGKLSQTECSKSKSLTKNFIKLDVNKDGFLTPDEMPVKKKNRNKKNRKK